MHDRHKDKSNRAVTSPQAVLSRRSVLGKGAVTAGAMAAAPRGSARKPAPESAGTGRTATPSPYAYPTVRNSLNPEEYGVYSNVDPAVPHFWWSQASERMLNMGERAAADPFNGYAEEVARLYPTYAQARALYR